MKGIILPLLVGMVLAGCTVEGAVTKFYVQNTRVRQKGPAIYC